MSSPHDLPTARASAIPKLEQRRPGTGPSSVGPPRDWHDDRRLPPAQRPLRIHGLMIHWSTAAPPRETRRPPPEIAAGRGGRSTRSDSGGCNTFYREATFLPICSSAIAVYVLSASCPSHRTNHAQFLMGKSVAWRMALRWTFSINRQLYSSLPVLRDDKDGNTARQNTSF